jgi:23S rRNA (cytidine1920-2'-O)/16S rRNA (cytidine1409-2'-O)-methyltransferase
MYTGCFFAACFVLHTAFKLAWQWPETITLESDSGLPQGDEQICDNVGLALILAYFPLTKQRLDLLLVERQFCESRQQAQRLIQSGAVQVNHQVIDKPGTAVTIDADIVLRARSPYVSRGGEKLAKALHLFSIVVRDRICLDGGISTGGFTDCLLQNGAQQVYGVDVGYGQVAWTLRTNPQVVLKERTNLRYLHPVDLYLPDAPWPDLGVMDVSFISLTKVLPAFWALLQPPREIILLVKPQFEVGKDRIGKGVVRAAQDQAEAITTVATAAIQLGWHYQGLTGSPLAGPAGNLEFLLWLSMDEGPTALTFNDCLTVVQATQSQLQPIVVAEGQMPLK